jgi:hypothetical protein
MNEAAIEFAVCADRPPRRRVITRVIVKPPPPLPSLDEMFASAPSLDELIAEIQKTNERRKHNGPHWLRGTP